MAATFFVEVKDLIFAILSLFAVVFVNGWTDAPNAIATSVGCGAMTMRSASLLAAAMNFLGTLFAALLGGGVAETMLELSSAGDGWIASTSALVTVVVWAVGAWFFALPTSESHALLSALAGVAIVETKSFFVILSGKWKTVIVGLAASLLFGYVFGYTARTLLPKTKQVEKRSKNAERAITALMAFAHGAQDGEKFFALIIGMTNAPKLLSALCVALLMSLGTSLGGGRIVKSVGKDLTSLTVTDSLCADSVGAFLTLISSLLGLPISTTHTKTTAVMGVASAKKERVNKSLTRKMLLAWILTFPCCALIGAVVYLTLVNLA